jgi:regulatory protein
MSDESEANDAPAARRLAASLLARRDYCSGELRSRLAHKGFTTGVIEELIDALRRERAVDDARYAQRFVSYHATRGHGPVRIARDLRGLGLDASLIDESLQEMDWNERARDVRRRKFGAGVPRSAAARAKQARLLHARGFTGPQIRAALGVDIDIADMASEDNTGEEP